MSELFTIGEVAQLLNIPTATLRYWEERGLFSVAKGANRYRRYTVRDLSRIADVVFLHNLGIPISRMNQLSTCSREDYAHQLETTSAQIEEKIRQYQQMSALAKRQMGYLEEIQRLNQCGFSLEDIPFEAVATFDYRERDKLTQYAQDPSCYVRYFDTRDLSTEVRGIIVPQDYSGQTILWQKRPGIQFLTFLIRERVDQDYESDLEQTLNSIRPDYKAGKLLARYMLTAGEQGMRIDYLKAYLEILP
jgi:DNA-binding transcriptional MerR regulator